MRILKPCLSRHQLRDVYFGYVRSVVEYCAPLFTNLSATDNCRLERLQRRFHRLLCGKDCVNDCFPSLEERRRKLSIKFLQTVMQPNHVLNALLPPMSSTGRFLLPSRRTFRRGRSFFFLVLSLNITTSFLTDKMSFDLLRCLLALIFYASRLEILVI